MQLSTAELSLWSLLKLCLIIVGAIIAVVWVIWKSIPEGGMMINRLPSEYTQRVDHDVLMQWLQTRSADPAQKGNGGINAQEIPADAFKQKKPHYTTLLATGTLLQLDWGGGLGSYGYLILTQESTSTQKIVKNLNIRTIPVQAGVLAWVEKSPSTED